MAHACLSARSFFILAGKIKNNIYKLKQLKYFFFKKWRMRILSARIFSKSFGGKINKGETDVKKETAFTTKERHF